LKDLYMPETPVNRDADKTIQALIEISSALSGAATIDELYKSIHKSLGRILNVDNIYIALYHEDKDSITFPYFVDEVDEHFIEISKISEKQSLVAKVINQQEALLATEADLLNMLSEGTGELVGTPCKVWIGAPLKIKDRAIGALALQSYTSRDMYDESDLDILRYVSDFIAIAIEQKQTETAQKESEDINHTFFEISRAVNAAKTLPELFKSIYHSLSRVVDVTNFCIALYENNTKEITLPFFVDEYDDLSKIDVTSLSSGSLINEVLKTSEPVFLKQEELEIRAEQNRIVGTTPLIWIGVPLLINNEIKGIIVVQSYTDPHLYDLRDVEILSSVSEQIAMVIDRKREEDARKKSEKINKTLFEIANAVNTTRNLQQLCKSIHKSLNKFIDVKNFSLSLYDKKDDQLNFLYRDDETAPRSFIENASKSTSFTYEVIRTGSHLLLDEQEQKELARKLGGEVIGVLAKSWLGIPLKVNNDVIGAIITQDYATADCFDNKDIELFTLVSGQIALAIDRKRVEDAEKKSKEINRVMFAVSNVVNAADNLYELYSSIHDTLGSVMDVSNFMIGIYDHKKDMISYPYFVDEAEKDFSDIHDVRTSGILASEIINSAKPFFITGAEIVERARRMGSRGLGAIPKQWFGVPLKIKKQVIGVIAVQSYTYPELYSQDDVGILVSVSDQIAMAIGRKQAEENIRQSEKVTRTLFSISNAVNTTDNLNELYRSIYNSLNTLIELPNFFIAIVDNNRTMHFPLFEDIHKEEIRALSVPDFELRPSITTDVIKSKKTLFLKKEALNKLGKENRIIGFVPVIWLGVPLLIRDEVIGVMAVQHYSDTEYFTEKDKDLFIAISDQVALAIDRKRSQEIILEREKQILQLSEQTQEFSLVAASIISMKEEREIFKHIGKAIVKYSDFQRVLISLFKNEHPFRDIVAYEGVGKDVIDKVREVEMPSTWYDAVFVQGEKIGRLTSYIPHTMKHILNQQATISGRCPPSDAEGHWHPDDNLFVEMRDQDGELIGIISVDDSKSGNKPTNETVRPLEIFSSLISQIMIFRKIQDELKDHEENLKKKVDERTKELTSEISERIQIEDKLKAAKIAAETAARAKGEFLTNMSHEIRTPLNGIMGMAEIAMANDLDDDLRKIIQTIDSEAGALLYIINQVLDFSKIEAEKLVLENIPFDLRNTFEKACSLFSVGTKKKGIEFISFLAPDVPYKLIGDPGRLRQVLLNLAGNAMKFTQKGEIFIKAEKTKEYKEKNLVEIRFIVKDTGIGIEESKHKAIFDSFSQADGSITRKYGGTGLGTTISKQIVELMGGKIGFESTIGKGSSFWFAIEFEQQQASRSRQSGTGKNLNGLEVLIADDNETNRFVLIEYLNSFGVEPMIMEDKKQGLDLIKQRFADDKPVDALIINNNYSNVYGFEFAKEIRQNNAFDRMPIIILTSIGTLGDAQICKEIGIDAYLLKPVRQSELKKAIATSLSNFNFEKERNKLITRHTIAEESNDNPCVMVVEDYSTNQQITMEYLASAGYQAVLAENGEIAVDLFKKQHFDIVMMDIQMPVMDGYEATRLIRQYESERLHLNSGANESVVKNRVPIIAMTAHAVLGYREKCLKADMNDYVSKPIRRESFLGMIAKWTSKSRNVFDLTGSSTGTEEIHSGEIPINLSVALKEFGDDKAFLIEVVNEFIQRLEKQLPVLKEAIIEKDAKTLEEQSHSIKGGAANLTAYNLSMAAHELENIGFSQKLGEKDLKDNYKVFENLEEEVELLKQYMHKTEFK
jgi:signal transduction histidine kinase/GAF domain-containing protein/DNA-binding response OmpR family regulator/HPt (histidine-containing phosphotransfer) domain-containing protein